MKPQSQTAGIILAAGEWPEITRAVRQQGVAHLSRAMAAAGLTSTTDAWGEVEGLIAYQDARAAGELLTRLSFMPYGPSPLFQNLKAAGIRSGFGDEWIRFATGNRGLTAEDRAAGRPFTRSVEALDDAWISPLFWAAVESTEEAVVNALVAAETMAGADGHVAYALPHDLLVDVWRRHRR